MGNFNQALAFACHSLSIFKCAPNPGHVHLIDTFDVATALACLCSSTWTGAPFAHFKKSYLIGLSGIPKTKTQTTDCVVVLLDVTTS